MNTENICKALYALPNKHIVARRESIIKPIIIAIIGVITLTINSAYVGNDAEALSMAFITAGVALILYGLLVAIMRTNSSKLVPYDNDAKCYLKYRERYFDRELVAPIIKALKSGDIVAIDQMPTTHIAAVTLVEYSSKSGIKAYGLYSYNEGGYRPLCEPVIVNGKK